MKKSSLLHWRSTPSRISVISLLKLSGQQNFMPIASGESCLTLHIFFAPLLWLHLGLVQTLHLYRLTASVWAGLVKGQELQKNNNRNYLWDSRFCTTCTCEFLNFRVIGNFVPTLHCSSDSMAHDLAVIPGLWTWMQVITVQQVAPNMSLARPSRPHCWCRFFPGINLFVCPFNLCSHWTAWLCSTSNCSFSNGTSRFPGENGHRGSSVYRRIILHVCW